MKLLRDLYDWVLRWAETPFGPVALFILAFCEASFFPIPPDVLLIALALSMPAKAYRYALISSAGSVIGGIGGFLIGYLLWHGLSDYFYAYIPGFSPEVFKAVQSYFDRYDFLVVFTAGFTPIPYKLITIGAGVFGVNFPIFIVASLVSRSARFFMVAWLLKTFGPGVRTFIDRYFNWLALAFMILLIGGFVAFGVVR